MKLPLGRVAQYIGTEGDFSGDAMAVGYSIDSRTILPGELFFAVKGERMDGHDYVASAMEKGAVGAVVGRKHLSRFTDKRNLLVVDADDALIALQKLGAKVRQLWGKKLIAVTGSAGKTTTKEMIAQVLATKFKVLKTQGNLNNHFGLPLQLLKLELEHNVAVVELGMSHSGEIAALSAMSKPDIGVVTNVAPVHLEYFDSIEGIAKAKKELIDALPENGIAVLNVDDERVNRFAEGFHGKVIRYGTAKNAGIRAEKIESLGETGSKFTVVSGNSRAEVELPLMGEHNVRNALAAIAVRSCFGIDLESCANALHAMNPAEKRGEILHIAGATIINDCYNSNPMALKAMVDALAAMPAKRRIVVAGEMLELGAAAEKLHRECGDYIASKTDILFGVRGLASVMVAAAKAKKADTAFFETPEKAGSRLAEIIRPGDAVLLKASRGVKLERALESFQVALGVMQSKSA